MNRKVEMPQPLTKDGAARDYTGMFRGASGRPGYPSRFGYFKYKLESVNPFLRDGELNFRLGLQTVDEKDGGFVISGFVAAEGETKNGYPLAVLDLYPVLEAFGMSQSEINGMIGGEYAPGELLESLIGNEGLCARLRLDRKPNKDGSPQMGVDLKEKIPEDQFDKMAKAGQLAEPLPAAIADFVNGKTKAADELEDTDGELDEIDEMEEDEDDI